MWFSLPTRLRVWLCGCVGLYGQSIWSVDTLCPPGVDRLALPEGWLLPGSVQTHPPVSWAYDTVAHALRWEALSESLRIQYKLYLLPQAPPRFSPLPFTALERWDSLVQGGAVPSMYPVTPTAGDTFTSRLSRGGSLIRSLTVGTGQNATLNSAFRLNLEGLIAPDLYLIAALTDENLPFQTATTQTFSDFDRVNIGLRWRKTQLLLGDLELRENRTYFANFYRNVLGVELRSSAGAHALHAAFAEAKGRFHTNSFMGQEGRQGPYPLTGKNGERFIPILAGSEKVYINGVLVRRGQDQEYVIDYAVGEITFTPKVPITAATRIVVDFEYADRSYGRSFLWLEEGWKGQQFSYTVSYFRQADNPRRPLDFTLTPEEERQLADLPAGQTVGLLSGVDTLPYEEGTVRYEQVDTLIGGDTVRFFRLSRDPVRAVYQVSFVMVGGGQGDYVREASSLNGNVFRWVGAGQGDYRVGRMVALPTSVEVLSLRHALQPISRLTWRSEIDFSRYSENRFAGRVTTDLASRQTLSWQVLPDSAPWQVRPELTFQHVGAQYQNADRVYEREYGRLWNFNDLGRRATENLVEGRFLLSWKNRYVLTPHVGWRSWGDSLRTVRLSALWEGRDTTQGLGGQYLIEYLPATAIQGRDRWFRQTGRIFYTLRNWQVGSAVWTERRQSTLLDTANFRFYEYTPFVRYQTPKSTFRLQYQWRREWQAPRGELPPQERLRFQAHMPQVEMTWQRERWSFSTTASYRIFLPGDTVFGLVPVRTLLSQNSLRVRLRPWEVEGFYQISAEQSPQRQILYVGVNPGQGTHEWRDLNGDGLQQIEEFFPAVNPLLANYVQVLRATGRFIPALSVSTLLALRWQPERRLKWLSYQMNNRIEQRQNAPDNRWYRYLPSILPADTFFIQWNLLHRQDLFLFRTATRGDQTFSFQYQLSQAVPLSGLQQQRTAQYSSRSRYNFSQRIGGELLVSFVQRRSQAPLQADLNYAYQGVEGTPQGIYQPSARWRSTVSVSFRSKQVLSPVLLRLQGWRLSVEQRWSWKAGAFVGIRVEPAFYQAPRDLPPLLSFDLLEGMQRGRNLFTSLTLNVPLSRFIELSALYEGRFTRQAPMHSARMQARANF